MLTDLQLKSVIGNDDYDTIKNVHAWALKHFEYRTDDKYRGVEEYWSSPQEIKESLVDHKVLIDDCDGFALLCREILDQVNIPNRLVLCQTETGEGHLVCETNGWILDNRQSEVVNFTKLGYTWHYISGYHAGDDWHEVAT